MDAKDGVVDRGRERERVEEVIHRLPHLPERKSASIERESKREGEKERGRKNERERGRVCLCVGERGCVMKGPDYEATHCKGEGERESGSVSKKLFAVSHTCPTQIVLIKWVQKVNSPTKPSTDCSLLLVKTKSGRFYWGVDFLEPFNQYIVCDKKMVSSIAAAMVVDVGPFSGCRFWRFYKPVGGLKAEAFGDYDQTVL